MSIGLGRSQHAATHGTKPVADMKPWAAHLEGFGTEALELPNVEVLKVTYEMKAHAVTAVLPPALSPTFPPVVSFVFFECLDSPWGAFRLAQTRVSCRSGTHPRALLVSAVTDNPEAAAALEARWGFKMQMGEVRIRFGYDETLAEVTVDGRDILRLRALDPKLLRPQDVHWIANMHFADTERGDRLVQFDPQVDVHRAEVLRPIVEHFDGDAWGEPLIEPSHPISADKLNASITFPKIRFICKPDEAAFTGTEILTENL